MNKFKKLAVTVCFLVSVQLFSTNSLYAQIGNPGCDPNCNCRNNDPLQVCPIDGGVVALIVLGAAYGIKKVVDNRKTEAEAF